MRGTAVRKGAAEPPASSTGQGIGLSLADELGKVDGGKPLVTQQGFFGAGGSSQREKSELHSSRTAAALSRLQQKGGNTPARSFSWKDVLTEDELALMAGLDRRTSRGAAGKEMPTASTQGGVRTAPSADTASVKQPLNASADTSKPPSDRRLSDIERERRQSFIMDKLRERLFDVKRRSRNTPTSGKKRQYSSGVFTKPDSTIQQQKILFAQGKPPPSTPSAALPNGGEPQPWKSAYMRALDSKTGSTGHTTTKLDGPLNNDDILNKQTRTPARVPSVSDALRASSMQAPASLARPALHRSVVAQLPDVSIVDQFPPLALSRPSAAVHQGSVENVAVSNEHAGPKGVALSARALSSIPEAPESRVSPVSTQAPSSAMYPSPGQSSSTYTVDANGRSVRINLGRTRLRFSEQSDGLLNIDIVSNGRQKGRHSLFVAEDGTLQPAGANGGRLRHVRRDQVAVALRHQRRPDSDDSDGPEREAERNGVNVGTGSQAPQAAAAPPTLFDRLLQASRNKAPAVDAGVQTSAFLQAMPATVDSNTPKEQDKHESTTPSGLPPSQWHTAINDQADVIPRPPSTRPLSRQTQRSDNQSQHEYVTAIGSPQSALKTVTDAKAEPDAKSTLRLPGYWPTDPSIMQQSDDHKSVLTNEEHWLRLSQKLDKLPTRRASSPLCDEAQPFTSTPMRPGYQLRATKNGTLEKVGGGHDMETGLWGDISPLKPGAEAAKAGDLGVSEQPNLQANVENEQPAKQRQTEPTAAGFVSGWDSHYFRNADPTAVGSESGLASRYFCGPDEDGMRSVGLDSQYFKPAESVAFGVESARPIDRGNNAELPPKTTSSVPDGMDAQPLGNRQNQGSPRELSPQQQVSHTAAVNDSKHVLALATTQAAAQEPMVIDSNQQNDAAAPDADVRLNASRLRAQELNTLLTSQSARQAKLQENKLNVLNMVNELLAQSVWRNQSKVVTDKSGTLNAPSSAVTRETTGPSTAAANRPDILADHIRGQEQASSPLKEMGPDASIESIERALHKAECELVDPLLQMKERRLVKARELAESMLREREHHQRIQERIRKQEAQVDQLMRALQK
ncbi:hypothetical protein THASP1DRAFT_31306 [Thamnocephalis sphaerospora]|uniref:Uncharacterized protein n=1 Tax=Thamnocephalis sphaerospora TaxID=78915 RepID=A0A4P9XLX7_9FUNG|nr:hypothetical protein THASP1DRAFT_31306 [Thamnocephalis sphaerospora]|eukprot:RKP06884.1 hypothetical protein THASP1DRAFT_31306 [Thamnocephalis sphaerospora]